MAKIAVFTLLLVCFCSTLGWAQYRNNGTHNLIVGRRGYNDLILYERTVAKGKTWNPFGKVSEDVTYPVTYVPPSMRRRITEIDAIDLIGNGKGGYAYITKGGINMSNVTIHFKSQSGKGYSFHLVIYGR
uniref:Venom protein family 3 protein 2 n=1 Tax=Pristhesancus plagipennis TaxID=1955184 RepID=A0A1Q1NPD4_PRIPG|nr:venom protein family 3 protein 2 [Pristhesancus plagipennis]